MKTEETVPSPAIKIQADQRSLQQQVLTAEKAGIMFGPLQAREGFLENRLQSNPPPADKRLRDFDGGDELIQRCSEGSSRTFPHLPRWVSFPGLFHQRQ